MKLCGIFVIFALGTLVQAEDSPIVQLKLGKVQGTVLDTLDHHKVFLYQGLQYGQANRFEKPKAPEKSWTGVYNATDYRDACPQFGSVGRIDWVGDYSKTETDNCLYLNVWTQQSSLNLTTSQLKPVMFWIHGGAYAAGTAFTNYVDQRTLVEKGDVVAVNINYRLGPLGFLTGQGTGVPPNLGLHDQILALKWVRDNIAHFGGDPNQVTIWGESAGSMSVSALILSPLAKGLFHRAIMQSGAVDAIQDSPDQALWKAKRLAELAGCPTDNIEKGVECLKTKPILELKKAQVQIGLFSPVIGHGDELLPEKSSVALKSGKFNHVDLAFGFVNNEGSTLVSGIGDFDHSNQTLESAHKVIASVMGNQAMNGVSQQKPEEIADFYIERLKKATNGKPTNEQIKIAVASASGDLTFDCPAVLFAEQMARSASKNRYYSYRLMIKPYENNSPWQGVTHGMDPGFLMNMGLYGSDGSQLQNEAHQLSKDWIQAWTSFAKNGSPGKMGSVEWVPAFEKNDTPVTRYLALDPTHYRIVAGQYKDNCDTFWKERLFA